MCLIFNILQHVRRVKKALFEKMNGVDFLQKKYKPKMSLKYALIVNCQRYIKNF